MDCSLWRISLYTDKSAAIPHNQLWRENVAKCSSIKLWQNVAKCGSTCALLTNYDKMQGIYGPSAEAPFVPTHSGNRWILGGFKDPLPWTLFQIDPI